MGMMSSYPLWSAAACRRFSACLADISRPAKLRSLKRRERKKSGSKLPHSKVAANSMRDGGSKRRVAATGGKRPAAARGLLLAANGCADQVLDRVGGGIVPFFRERASARPTRQGRCRVGDGFLGVADQDRRSRVSEIGISLQVAQAKLRVLRCAEKIEPVGAPFPNAESQALRARGQAAVARQVHHFDKLVGRGVAALPDFQRDEQIGWELVR